MSYEGGRLSYGMHMTHGVRSHAFRCQTVPAKSWAWSMYLSEAESLTDSLTADSPTSHI